MNRPLLTFAEDGNVWSMVEQELKSRFPLRNIQLLIRQEHRMIPSLDMEIRKYHPEMFPKFVPGALEFNSYFVHLFLLPSEDVDLYKTTTKKLMQEWWNVVAKKNQEWLIVCVSGGQQKTRLFTSSATVYERIKSDLNIKKDRVFQVSLGPNNVHVWNDLIVRIKECVVQGVTSQIMQYEEDCRRLEQQRQVPGWNYCQYFIMKEALSFTFEMMLLYNDALVQYDELEATFFQTLEEQGAPWFKKFGGMELGDDNQDIFNLKSSRDLIIQNNISIFDFRMYLFSRQVALLNIQHQPIEICKRAKMFISTFSKTLSEYKDSLVPHFREAWIYSMVMNMLRHCDELLAISGPSIDVVAYEGLKGELYLSARYQLDRLGVASKLLSNSLHCEPLELPDIENVRGSDITVPDVFRLEISNDALKQIMVSKSSFDSAYEKLTLKCVRSFELCQRPATVAFLKADLAFLCFARQNYVKAAQLFEEICFGYGERGWNHIDTVLIERYCICQRQLRRNTNLLRSFLHLIQYPTYLILESVSHYLGELKRVAKEVDVGYQAKNNQLLQISGLVVMDNLSTGEPLKGELVLYSHIPEEFHFDTVTVIFATNDGAEMHFVFDKGLDLKHGSNRISVTAQRSTIPGKYTAKSLCIRYQKLEFVSDIPLKIQRTTVLDIERTGSSLEFRLAPSSVADANELDLCILTGDTTLFKPELEFLYMTSIEFELEKQHEFKFTSGGEYETWKSTNVDGKLTLPALGANSKIKTCLKFRSPEGHAVNHIVKLTLRDVLNNNQKIVYSKVIHLQLTKPLILEHCISHNSESSIIRYTLTGNDSHPMRVITVSWEPDSYVQGIVPEKDYLLFPNQKSTFFGVVLPDTIKEKLKINLKIEYRLMNKEIEHYILSRCTHHSKVQGVPLAAGVLRKHIRRNVLGQVNSYDLCYNGYLKLKPLDSQAIVKQLLNLSKEQSEKVLAAIEGINSDLEAITESHVEQTAKSLDSEKIIFSQSISHCDALISSKWTPVNSLKKVQVGESVQFILAVTPIFLRTSDPVEFVTVIEPEHNRLAVGGKQKISIKLEKETDSVEFPITVCPLKPGILFLPNIRFDQVSSLEGICFSEQNDQTDIMVIPVEESCRRYIEDSKQKLEQ